MEFVLSKILIAALIIFAILLFFCLYRAIKGPQVADRLMAVNMMGTIVIVIITILAILLKEGYLMDIGIIYAMMSFLAVIVLTKLYIGTFVQRGGR